MPPLIAEGSDSGSSASDGITNIIAPILTGTSEANSTITLYGTDGASALGSAIADGDGAWTIAPGTLGAGVHSLTVEAVDAAGNSSSASAALTLTIDTTAPPSPGDLTLAPGSDSGAAGDLSTRDATPTITGTAEANSVVSLYESGSFVGSGTADVFGYWTITSSQLDDGQRALTATAIDVAGNTSSASAPLTLTIDTVAATTPTGLALDIYSNSGSTSDLVTNDETPTITGTAEAGSVVSLYDDGVWKGDGTADGSGHWSIISNGLLYGERTLTATAVDVAGNTSASFATLTLTIDTSADTPTGLSLAPSSDTGTLGDQVTTVRTPTITGTAEAGATIRLYEGSSVLGTIVADGTTGVWSVPSSRLALGTHTLYAMAVDVAGNTSSSSSTLTLTIDAPASPPPPPASSTVDGVTVGTGTQTNSDGTTSTVVTIPVVTGGRSESVGGNTVADIPLVKTSGGASLLTAQVPTGLGLTMTGSSNVKTAGSSLTDLIREIQAHTEAGSNDQSVLTGGGSGFLGGIPADTPLLVQTIVPTAAPGATASAEPLVITGTPATAGNPYTALVIDTRGLPSGTTIQLQNVEFAAVIGAVRVTGGEGSQNVWGDGEAQYIVLGADDDTLHGGGGDDHVGSHTGNDILYGDTGADTVTGGEDDDLVYGNQQDDIVYGNQGSDTLYGGQDQDIAFGGQGEDAVYGNRGNDVVYGNKGADTLFGGQGDDVLFGNRGDDTLTGGLGADLFAFHGSDGGDLITDFRFEEGDRLAADGRSWTVSDGEAGAVVDFGSGDKVTLANIKAEQVTAAWFKTG